jgi:alkylation response protein AidB-like acyl-CoA dehydrogenase
MAVAVALLAAGPAVAQQQESVPASPLPIPSVDENAGPREFLTAARQAVVAGQAGLAEEALERAESRVLDRDVRPSRADQPSEQMMVKTISDARAALHAGDKAKALSLIDQAVQQQASNG